MELKEIYASIRGDLDRVKANLHTISDIKFTWLAEQLAYIVRGSGKGIRPALTLLSGRFYDYDLTKLMPMACAVELLHTATLVHDDAIDKSSVRRGNATINKLFGEDVAILMGDYLFAKAGEFVSDTQSPRAIKLFSQTLGTISSGEINQYLNAFKIEQTREDYIQRIASKTASLFSLATQSGGILSNAPEPAIEALREYGWLLGIAFQIVDDILDFTSDQATLGKPVGSDLRQGTLTLPAMMLLQRYPHNNPVRRIFAERGGDRAGLVSEAIALLQGTGIADECYKVAHEYRDRACRSLDALPSSNSSQQALKELALFVTARAD